VRTLGTADSIWAKSKTFRLVALTVFFLILIASPIVVLYVFRTAQFLIFVTSIIIGIIAYWRRPQKQTRYSENSISGQVKTLKKHLETLVRGWLPKEHPVLLAQKMPKPIWWRPLWITVVILTIASGILGFICVAGSR
jgi:hypothetical protein